MDTIKIESRNRAELEQIAKDISAGKLWHSSMLPDGLESLVFSIFLPLEQAYLEGLLDWEKIGIIYEYVDNAIKWNGNYPLFKTCNIITQADCALIQQIVHELKLTPPHASHDENCGCDQKL